MIVIPLWLQRRLNIVFLIDLSIREYLLLLSQNSISLQHDVLRRKLLKLIVKPLVGISPSKPPFSFFLLLGLKQSIFELGVKQTLVRVPVQIACTVMGVMCQIVKNVTDNFWNIVWEIKLVVVFKIEEFVWGAESFFAYEALKSRKNIKDWGFVTIVTLVHDILDALFVPGLLPF